MQLANILLSLGGDAGNTVPKTAITPSEVAVLRLIHGEESVKEIEPYGQVDRTSRQERARLVALYGRVVDGQIASPQVNALFPGVAARLYEDFSELELPEEFYKAVSRVSDAGVSPRERREAETASEAPATHNEVVHPLDHDGDGKKGGSKKGSRKAKAEPAPEPASDPVPEAEVVEDDGVDDDGIEDMPDAENLFS